jgi:hypothetical protein
MVNEPKPPMLSDLLVTIVPTRRETRILVMVGRDEVMKARLAPPSGIFPGAVPMLLEALALWYRCRLRVVISVDADVVSPDLGLLDGIGCGAPYDVEWVDLGAQHGRGARAQGLGDVRDVRRPVRLVKSR